MKRVATMLLALVMAGISFAQDGITVWHWDVDTVRPATLPESRSVPHGDLLRIQPRVLDDGVARTWPGGTTFVMKYQVESMIVSNLWWTNGNVSALSSNGAISALWDPQVCDRFVQDMTYYCWIGAYSNNVALCHPIRFTMNMQMSPDWMEGAVGADPVRYVVSDAASLSNIVNAAIAAAGSNSIPTNVVYAVPVGDGTYYLKPGP